MAGYTGPSTKTWRPKTHSVQQAKLDAVIQLLEDVPVPSNTVSDSQYAVRVTSIIETISLSGQKLSCGATVYYFTSYRKGQGQPIFYWSS